MTTSSVHGLEETLAGTLGEAHVNTDVSAYSIDGLRPQLVVSPGTIADLGQTMAHLSAAGVAVAPWGGGTRTALGNPMSRLDVAVDLTRLNRIVRYNPADLTATVEAGLTVAGLQNTLAKEGQLLALDPPLPDRATIGGTLAIGLSGPLKWQYGSPRDVVIGMKVVQADGKVTKSGGQVVKNVSGYDMARLHIGGLGTLGIIAEVSFKLTPLPQNQATVVATFQTSRSCLEAALSVFHSDTVPLALTALDRSANERARALEVDADHMLAIRLGGRPRTIERQIGDCEALCRRHGASMVEMLAETHTLAAWRAIADFGWETAADPMITCRASVLPAQVPDLVDALASQYHDAVLEPAILAHPAHGTVLVSWSESGPDDSTSGAPTLLNRTVEAVHAAGGRMLIEKCPMEVKAHMDVWDSPGESIAIMHRMKELYDPKATLNPGRFVGGI